MVNGYQVRGWVVAGGGASDLTFVQSGLCFGRGRFLGLKGHFNSIPSSPVSLPPGSHVKAPLFGPLHDSASYSHLLGLPCDSPPVRSPLPSLDGISILRSPLRGTASGLHQPSSGRSCELRPQMIVGTS